MSAFSPGIPETSVPPRLARRAPLCGVFRRLGLHLYPFGVVMRSLIIAARRGACSVCAVVLVAGRVLAAQQAPSLHPAPIAAPTGDIAPEFSVTPVVVPSDGNGLVRIRAPGADSIAFESVNGIDRYGTRGAKLNVMISG